MHLLHVPVILGMASTEGDVLHLEEVTTSIVLEMEKYIRCKEMSIKILQIHCKLNPIHVLVYLRLLFQCVSDL